MDMSDAVIVKSSRLKSVVWNDFDRIKKGDTCVAVCRHCKRKLSGSSTSGTSHLRNHLVRCQRRASNGLPPLYNGRETKRDMSLSMIPSFNNNSNNNNLDQDPKRDEVLSLVNFRFEQDQMKDDSFDQRRSRFDLARMIILHGYSLGMVEDVGFRVFVKNLQPLFELVSCDRVEADCIEIYAKEKQKVSEVLDKLLGKISLSAEKWVSPDFSADYLCLTAHYIDESWRLKRKILNFIAIDPSQSEDTHSDLIMTCLMDWDIDRKLFSMTFDSSSNDNVAVRISDRLSQNKFLYSNGRLFDVRCAASLVFTMVQDALAWVSEIADKIRESVRYVKSSQTLQTKFNELVREAGLLQPQKCLCLDNPQRWDSTFFMLEAALEHKEAFLLLQEKDDAYTYSPSELEWDRANTITGFLRFFVELINGFVRNKSATANLYFPDLCDVYLQLNEWCKNSDDLISSLGFRMRARFEEYWERCGLGLAVAAMLDPRFKMKLVEYYYAQIYGAGAPARIDDVFESVKALYNEHSVCLASLDQDMAWQENGGLGPGPGRESRDRLMGFDKFLNETSQGEGTKSDLDKYLEEPLFPRNAEFGVLNWWRVHTPRYPILATMARNVLGVPMSKAVSESAFGIGGGRGLDRSWGSLSTVTLQALFCSQDWIRSELES